MKKACPERSRGGFTLIELLVVLAIIAILATIMLMVLSQAKQKARVAAGKKSVSSITAAIAICRYGSGEVLPPVNNGYICSPQSITADIYPNLAGTGWQWTGLASGSGGGSDDTVVITAICTVPQCGTYNAAYCGLEGSISTPGVKYGCIFAQWPS